MENKEEILSALESFNSKDDSITEIPEILESVIRNIAKTGETVFPWPKLKQLMMMKVDLAMKTFQESASMDSLPPLPNVENVKFEGLRKRILDRLVEFTGAPFTIQRIAELVVEPKKYYKRTDKFLRGIEKNVMVVTTVDTTGNIIVNDSKLLNGMDENGFSLDKNSGFLLTTSAASSAAPARKRAGWSALSDWLQKPTIPRAGTTSSLFSSTAQSDSTESKCEADPEATASEDSLSQGSEDSSQGSEQSESSSSSLSGDEGSSHKVARAEEAAGPIAQSNCDRLELPETSTGFQASNENIDGEEYQVLKAETDKKETLGHCEEKNASTCPKEGESGKPENSHEQQVHEQLLEKSEITSTADSSPATEGETKASGGEPMETEEMKDDVKEQDGHAAEEGQGDSAEKQEVESDESEEMSTSKKRKSEEIAALDTPPSKRLVAEGSGDREPVTSPDRRESCGFETNPNCEEVDATSGATPQDGLIPTQACDVTSSGSVTSQTVGNNMELKELKTTEHQNETKSETADCETTEEESESVSCCAESSSGTEVENVTEKL